MASNYIELPPFVDDEIVDLHKQYLQHEELLANIHNSLQEIHDRHKVLKDHKVNVEQELEHTKQVLAARNQETLTEEHFISLASREKGKLEADIRNNKRLLMNYVTDSQSYRMISFELLNAWICSVTHISSTNNN
ncbi:hypothetical protein GEMRC1_010824 [Eukaryota sp. GEM-RC1]